MAEEIIERPVLKIKWTLLDYLLEFIAAAFIISTIVYAIIAYNNLPDTVATHFDFKGEPDAFGNKSSIWAMPIVSFVLWMLLSIVNQFPHSFNYPFKLTNTNVERQYRMAQRFMRIMKIWVCGLFLYVLNTIVESSKSQDYKMNYGIFVILGSMIIFMSIYLYISRKNK